MKYAPAPTSPKSPACSPWPTDGHPTCASWPTPSRCIPDTTSRPVPPNANAGNVSRPLPTDLPGHHYPRLDAFHRNHAGIESVIKDGKDLGLRRLPSHSFAFNQAWCTTVAIAADLLAWLRHLALDHHPLLRKATPATLRRTLLHIPARLVHHARNRLIRLCDDHPHQADLILAWNKIRAQSSPP